MADVLIVEDEEDVAAMLMMLLELRGHEVRWAFDGVRGLEMLLERAPDVMIVDVEMPRLSGPDMVREASARDRALGRVPVLLVSGVMGLPAIAAELGTPYFLAKPFDVERLFDLLRRAVADQRAPSVGASP